MSKGKGPLGRVPFSKAVKRSLIILGGIFALAGGVEWYELSNPDEVAPMSWAFWWLKENVKGIVVLLAGVGGGFYSHFFWYLRPGDFWFPIRLRTAVIIASATLGSIAAVQAWGLFWFAAAFLGAPVAAHRWWYRIESFDEHLAQFHDEEEDEHVGVGE